MSAVVIDGGLVHYETIGRGKPILFLHGWLGSWRYWMPAMKALSDKNRTYALDFWGFGDSDKSKPRYRVSDYVTLVDTFASNLGIGDVSLIGHALGATVALEFAARHPERVDRIMAVSLPLNSDCINRKLLYVAGNSLMAKMMGWQQQISHQEVQKEAEKTDGDAIAISLQSVAQMDMDRCLHDVAQAENTMLLIVYGEKDDVIDPTPAGNLNGTWPHVRQIGLPKVKHFPMLDEAAKFNRLLKDFLVIEKDLSVLELKEEWRRRTR